MEKEYILVSSCLLGENTKYNGKNNYTEGILALKEKYNVISYCAEQKGGLPTPRIPSEIKLDRVFSSGGKEVTKEFNKGAIEALKLVKKYNIKKCVLKDGSPSCGVYKIYDGTFSGTKIDGMGITAKLLSENGVLLFTELTFKELL